MKESKNTYRTEIAATVTHPFSVEGGELQKIKVEKPKDELMLRNRDWLIANIVFIVVGLAVIYGANNIQF